MYGPPPSPLQVDIPSGPLETPLLFWGAVLVGLAISALALRKSLSEPVRALAFTLGQTIALTSPLLFRIEGAVYGDFPTIDKEGSLLFYLDGVHRRLTLHPIESLQDQAAQLIGVHVGHLWYVELFDLLLSPFGAFNALALLLPVLAWWATSRLARAFGATFSGSLVLAAPFGLGLHLFRDLNWYTIEKAAIFWLPLYGLTLLAAHRQGRDDERGPSPDLPGLREAWGWPIVSGLCLAATAFTNWYLAILSVFAVATLTLTAVRSRGLWRASIAGALAILPLVALQFALVAHGGPGDPEAFLTERAMLDNLSLYNLRWNRLELWRAVELVTVAVALFGAWRARDSKMVRSLLALVALFTLLALGPELAPGVRNPLYMLLWVVMPGFWRVAKPEVFFYVAWLSLIALAAIATTGRRLWWAYPLFLLWWFPAVRGHDAFPGFTQPLERSLSPQWRSGGD